MAYGKVEETFWHDDLIRRLSEDGRSFMLYLLTSPHRTRLGMFVLDMYYAAADMQWDLGRVTAARDELVGVGRVCWDEATRTVYLTRHWRHNVLHNPKAVRGAVSDLQGLPQNPYMPTLLADLEAHSRAHYGPLISAVRSRVENSKPPEGEEVSESGNAAALCGDSVNSALTEPSTSYISSCSRAVTEAEEEAVTTSPVDSTRRGNAPHLFIVRSDEVEDMTNTDILAKLPRPSLDALGGLKHRGSKKATARTLVACFLYPDGETDLADESVRGVIALDHRITLVGKALIEYAANEDHWNSALFGGYVRRLKARPKPGTVAAKVATKAEPGGSRYIPSRPYTEPEAGGLEPVNVRDLLARNGVEVPGDAA